MTFMDSNWVVRARVSDAGQVTGAALLNLGCVRAVEIVSQSAVKLHFSETHTVTLDGKDATDFVGYLMKRAILPNGEPALDK